MGLSGLTLSLSARDVVSACGEAFHPMVSRSGRSAEFLPIRSRRICICRCATWFSSVMLYFTRSTSCCWAGRR